MFQLDKIYQKTKKESCLNRRRGHSLAVSGGYVLSSFFDGSCISPMCIGCAPFCWNACIRFSIYLFKKSDFNYLILGKSLVLL